MEVNWGDVPSWVAAIGTVGALFAALLQIRNERLERKKIEVQEQAAEVSTWISNELSSEMTNVIIQNTSTNPIYDVVLTIVIASGSGPRTGEEVAALPEQRELSVPSLRRASSIIPPGRYVTEIPADWGGMNRKPGAEIAFTDKSGNHWVRRQNGKLEQLKFDALSTMSYPSPFGDLTLKTLAP